MNKFFKIFYNSEKSKARLGQITTDHGVIKTPAFVPVATKGTLKTLTPKQIKEIGVQVSFVNTYHLVTHPGVELIKKAGGIHKLAQLNYPLMSDSGGFQVFSLALPRSREVQSRKKFGVLPSFRQANIHGEETPLVVKISDDGVKFRSIYDGQLIEFTPEKSMEYQEKIGADLNMAFDECTYYPATHEYAEKAMKRTHEWLKRCLEYKTRHQNFFASSGPPVSAYGSPASQVAKNPATSLKAKTTIYNLRPKTYLYGIIQGGTFEDLRKKSAEFIVSQPVDGVAIGGVSVGETKKEMRNQVKWVADCLPKDKPIHLLGVGQFDDIIDLVKYGIDTFDCVEPTRLARMGTLYSFGTHKFLSQVNSLRSDIHLRKNFAFLINNIDINKNIYQNNLEPVDINCQCWVCKNFTKAYLHHLFKQKEILGYTLATYHNLWVMEKFMELIRLMIEKNQL